MALSKSDSSNQKEEVKPNKSESARKKSMSNKTNKELTLRKRLIPCPVTEKCLKTNHNGTESLPLSVCYPQCFPTYPVLEWKLPSPMYNIPSIPVIVDTIPVLGTHVLCPYVSGIIAPIALPTVVVQEEVPPPSYIEEIPTTSSFAYEPVVSYANDVNAMVAVSSDLVYYEKEVNEVIHNEYPTREIEKRLESYLTLPKELFPSTKALNLDPNVIIDEFCKLNNIKQHTSWILDLEFGIPKSPITRPIPSYNPKFNSIHCKNTPGAIHPGFESCSEDFKRALLFYYDCIVSSLYRGYIIMKCDRSVENFQSWLLLPMQALGMCWL